MKHQHLRRWVACLPILAACSALAAGQTAAAPGQEEGPSTMPPTGAVEASSDEGGAPGGGHRSVRIYANGTLNTSVMQTAATLTDDFTLVSPQVIESVLIPVGVGTPLTGTNRLYFLASDAGGFPGAVIDIGTIFPTSEINMGTHLACTFPLTAPVPLGPGHYWIGVIGGAGCGFPGDVVWYLANGAGGDPGLISSACTPGGPFIPLNNLYFELYGPGGAVVDCNANGIADDVDIANGTSQDCDNNGIPDECLYVPGIQATYFSTMSLSGPAMTRVEPVLYDDFAGGSPSPLIPADQFSGRFDGRFTPRYSESYTISVITDDGARVWVGGNLVIDAWFDNSNVRFDSSPISLAAGVPVDFRVEWFENGGAARIELDWSSASEPFAPIPASALDHVRLDCNSDNIPDACQLAAGDCDGNGFLDTCDAVNGTSRDCDSNGTPDACEPSADCNNNGTPDSCDIASGYSLDCNTNGVPDECDIASGSSLDCNQNGTPDDCEIAGGYSPDCNSNGVPDSCDIASGTSLDCNHNGVPDACDIASGTSQDCSNNGIPDECEPDCNANGTPDPCDIINGTSADCDANGVPDECDPDCNGNGVPDGCDVVLGTSQDCNHDLTPDECQLGGTYDQTSDHLTNFCNDQGGGRSAAAWTFTGTPPAMGPVTLEISALADLGDDVEYVDVTLGGVYIGEVLRGGGLNDCDFRSATMTLSASQFNALRGPNFTAILLTPSSAVDCFCDNEIWVRLTYPAGGDCNNNGIPDDCDITSGTSTDCNGDGIPDECSGDCNNNGTWDAVDICNGASDCNGNLVPDECEDCNHNGRADSCDVVPNVWTVSSPVLSPFGAGFPVSYLFAGVPSLATDVEIRLDIFGQFFDQDDQAIDVLLNGTLYTTIQQGTNGYCVQGHPMVLVPTADWSVLLAGGSTMNVELVPHFGAYGCEGGEQAQITLYSLIAPVYSQDCNKNGVPDECDIASGTSQDCNNNQIPDECDTRQRCIDLDVTLANLNAGHAGITALVPNIFEFAYDGGNNNISDGGNDMYDGGNFLNTDLATGFNYTNGTVVTSDAQFGVGSSYFTAQLPGLFVLAASEMSIDQFSLSGNLGADGSGFFNATELATTVGGRDFTLLVKRVGGAGDPTINHIIIVPGAVAGLVHDYALDTDNDMDRVSGLTGRCNLFYLLVARGDDEVIDDNTAIAMANTFLDMVAYPANIADCNRNQIPDSCEPDCNANGTADECDITSGFSEDLNTNGIPDECENGDCNANGIPDAIDIADGTSQDCNTNAVPDECEMDGNDCNSNGILDECEPPGTFTITLNCPPPYWRVHCNDPSGFIYYPDYVSVCRDPNFYANPPGPYPFGVTTGIEAWLVDRYGNESNHCFFDIEVVGDQPGPIRQYSAAALDGSVLESKPGTGVGAMAASASIGLAIGDDSNNRQSQGIFSFDLANQPIPSSAIITGVSLRLTRTGQAGNPAQLGPLTADLAPFFGTGPALAPSDFEATAGVTTDVMTFSLPGTNGACTFGVMNPTYFPRLNRAGTNQFRVHFAQPWRATAVQDSITIATGENINAPPTRPELVIDYYLASCTPCNPPGAGGPLTNTVSLGSTAAEDGYLKEAHWTSEVGLAYIDAGAYFDVGDTVTREQLVGLLSFDTSSIPADARITSARLRLVRYGATGNPASLGSLVVDMTCAGVFGTLNLEPSDFQAFAGYPAVATVPIPIRNGQVVLADLAPEALPVIHTGDYAITQFRFRFTTPDNGNSIADYLMLGTGDGGTGTQPRLIVTYEYGGAPRAPSIPQGAVSQQQ